MKRVNLPKDPRAAAMVRNTVLTLAFWKLDGLKRVEAHLEIDAALTKDSEQPVVSDDTANLWAESMKLTGPNGMPAVTVPDPQENLLFMRIMRAVLRAETVDEPAGSGG